jgi:hypothetical protein
MSSFITTELSHGTNISVRFGTRDPAWGHLLSIVESLLPVSFSLSAGRGPDASLSEVVMECESNGAGHAGSSTELRVAINEPRGSSREIELVEVKVIFADDADVPFPFRGRTVRTKVSAEFKYLSVGENEKVMATADGRAVWVVSVDGSRKRYRSCFGLPIIAVNENLRNVLNGHRFLEILPFLHFLRQICEGESYEGPSLRACFIFDDPNLHWPRYGFVDYSEIANRAARVGYHVSFAMIPLDTWFTHKATAEIFRRRQEQISLLIHGNNHTFRECARRRSKAQRVYMLSQAIHRIERFERATGLQVSRVMAPPHGACSDDLLEELPKCGFEAATISHGSLCAYNSKKAWTKTLGYLPSELVRGGPVLPRWGVFGNTACTILLAAYLRQPMILMAHHQDLRDGIELLDERARFINSLGPVRWSNMTDLSRASYQWRVDGTTMKIRAMSWKIVVRLARESNSFVIENSGGFEWRSWKISGLIPGAPFHVRSGEPVLVPEGFDGALCAEAVVDSSDFGGSDSVSFGLPVWAACRRLLTESRDRSAVLGRILRNRHGQKRQISRPVEI